MAEMKVTKKRLSINLSFLTLTDPKKLITAHKSPKIFEEPNGVVGLGIVAALNNQDPIFINGGKISSNPVPILSNKRSFSKINTSSNNLRSVEEMELCEEYTCVISRVGENLIKKREYYDADFLGNSNGADRVSADSKISCGIADFLSSCFLCKKMLHGLDIFMYRGENAFCSAECRCRQISIDEQKEKRRSGVRKAIELSASPCSGTLQFFAGVAAA